MTHSKKALGSARCRLLLFAMAAVLPSGQALAQVAHDGTQLTEIVVTAEKRERSLDRTPIAITTYTADQIEAQGLVDLRDLMARTPNVIVSQSPLGGGAPFIRGVGPNAYGLGVDPNVSIYVDGVLQPRATAFLADFLDVGRVEVLRGPQGTLYGRNATSGAMNIISQEASPEFGLRADVEFGNYDNRRLRAAVNVPLATDVATLRVAGTLHEQDSYRENTLQDVRRKQKDLQAIRGALTLTPSEDVTITLAADYLLDKAQGELPMKLVSMGPLLASFAPLFGVELPEDDFEVHQDLSQDMTIGRLEHYGFSGTLDWDIGDLTLTSITGYRKLNSTVRYDADITEIPFLFNLNREVVDQFSEEVRLGNGSGSNFEWLVGAFYFTQDGSGSFDTGIPLLGDLLATNTATIKTKAFALFGQASYMLTPQLRATAGARYSWERKRHTLVQSGVTAPLANGSESWNSFTPRIGLDYFIDDNTMLYASISKGFKSGGFNSSTDQPPFDPETLWSYEAGLKGSAFDKRLRFALSGFYYDYSDLQVTVFVEASGGSGRTVTSNAASARLYGFEAELTALPVENLLINASLAAVKSEYRDFVTRDPNFPGLGPQDLSGNNLAFSPRMTANFGIQYGIPLGTGTKLTPRFEVLYHGNTNYDPFNYAITTQGGYATMDGRLTLDLPMNDLYIAAYVKNLADKHYLLAASSTETLGLIHIFGAPRQIGVQAGIRF